MVQIGVFTCVCITMCRLLTIKALYVHQQGTPGQRNISLGSHTHQVKAEAKAKYICLTSVTRVKCGIRSTLCWKVGNNSGST